MKILFFAHDPGGANAIAPLIHAWEDKHHLIVYGKGAALNILPKVQKLPQDLDGPAYITPQILQQFLANIQPDIVITGTSAYDFIEKYLWVESQTLGIKSIAILDHWVNYGIRFSQYTVGEKALFRGQCSYLPTAIIVMDDFAAHEMVLDGVPEDRIFALGNPHFENTIKNVPKISNHSICSGRKRIIFASEPLLEDYGSGAELAIAKALCKYVHGKSDIECIVRLHPRESIQKYAQLQDECIFLDKHTNAAELIASATVVVSQTSMFLIEAVLQNKACISYQPTAKDKNAFILTKNEELPFIQTEHDFFKELDQLLSGQKKFQYNLLFNTDICERITHFIEETLWQN